MYFLYINLYLNIFIFFFYKFQKKHFGILDNLLKTKKIFINIFLVNIY